MGRKYPRFLYCEPNDSKSKGPFIIHTLPPRFVCIPHFHKRHLMDVSYVDNWDNADRDILLQVVGDLKKWFHFSGKQHSKHPQDILLIKLAALDFLKVSGEYTVTEVAEVLKACFPTKTQTINRTHNLNRLKYIALTVPEKLFGISKYCNTDIVMEALTLEGFKFSDQGANISNVDFKNILELVV